MSSSLTLTRGVHKFRSHYAIVAYGVRIAVSCNVASGVRAAKKRIAQVLPEFRELPADSEVEHRFFYVRNDSGRDSLYRGSEPILKGRKREQVIDWLGSEVRLTAAEHAVGLVFIHSAAVTWKGKGILIPAHTFKGKTALTAELIRRGAVYYSDEYSILDANGLLHPFPKKLSIRQKEGSREQSDKSVEDLGGIAGTTPAPVRMVLLTEYKPGAKWAPRELTPGKAVIEILRNTLPIRRDPRTTLSLLREVMQNAVTVKTKRDDAAEAADELLKLFEERCLSAGHNAAS